MRNIARLVVGLAVLPMAACAAGRIQAVDAPPATPEMPATAEVAPGPAESAEHQGAPDSMRFCYFAGQAFSPGAVHDGMVCGAPQDGTVYRADRAPQPLQWLPVQE